MATSLSAHIGDRLHVRADAPRPLPARHLAAVTAALVVVYVVAHALLLHRFPWFVDETYFAINAQAGAGDPAHRFDALIDHKGLIVEWIAMVLLHFGVAPVDALRLIAIASGVVVAAASGVLVWRWWADAALALATAAVVAFVPYLFVHDSVGVLDPFVGAFSMVALVLQLELARRPRLDLSIVLGVVLGVLILAKPTGQLAVVLLPLSLVVLDWSREGLARRLASWAGFVLLALAIAAALWSLSRLSPLANTPEPANHRTLSELFDDPFGQLSGIWPGVRDAMWGYLTPGGVVLGIWGLIRVVVERHRVGIVVALWGFAALAAYLLLTDYAFPRYGLQAVAPFCVLAVAGAADVWRRVLPRIGTGAQRAILWRAGIAVVAVLAVGPGLVLDLRVLARPGDAPYPGMDRGQFNVLVSNRGPVQDAAKEILRRSPQTFTDATPAADRTVVGIGGWVWAGQLALNGRKYTTHPRFTYLDVNAADQSAANAARFVIVDGVRPPGWFRLGHARLVHRWSRPGGGPPLLLYDRGA